jgi:hypothetical protein
MKEDEKLINVIIDLGLAVKELRGGVKDLCTGVKDLHKSIDILTHRIGGLEKQQQKTNKELSEMRLSFMQYSDAIQRETDHEKRIHKLERMILK